jgi:hypothetical protein
MIILRHGPIVLDGARAQLEQQYVLQNYLMQSGAHMVVSRPRDLERVLTVHTLFEIDGCKVNTFEKVDQEIEDFPSMSHVNTYTGRVVIKGPNEQKVAKNIIDHFGNKIVAIRKYTIPEPKSSTNQNL